jgi:DNA helicase-2/ATP-dependent DNA helicase PcrA
MYVAITRARRRLYLTFAQSRMLHGQTHYGMASSFLRELPDELLHWLTARLVPRRIFNSSSNETASYVAAFGSSPSTSSSNGGRGESTWRIGQRVFHQKFGEGTIIGLEGNGADERVQVNFKHAGSKWLALEYAKLAAV